MQVDKKVKTMVDRLLFYAVSILISCVFVLPMFYMLVSSFKTDQEILRDMSSIRAFLPSKSLNMENFVEVIRTRNFLKYFRNSTAVMLVNVIFGTVVNAMAGYALGMLRFKGKKVLISLIIALSIIPAESVIINRFLVVLNMGLINTVLGLALPTIGYPMYIFLYYNHFKGMPIELIEAAVVDGENYRRIFWRIILPLSKPIVCTVAILGFVKSWGDLLWPVLVTRDDSLRTLPLALRALSSDVYVYWGQIFAFATMMTLPVLIVFLAFQKQFISSIAMTGIKG